MSWIDTIRDLTGPMHQIDFRLFSDRNTQASCGTHVKTEIVRIGNQMPRSKSLCPGLCLLRSLDKKDVIPLIISYSERSLPVIIHITVLIVC